MGVVGSNPTASTIRYVLARPRQSKDVASVYLISDGVQRTKIGLANNPVKRLATLRTANADKLELVHQWRLLGRAAAAQLEAQLHRLFKFAKIRREWFAISPRFVIAVGDQILAGDARVEALIDAIEGDWQCWKEHDEALRKYDLLHPRWDKWERNELMGEMEDLLMQSRRFDDEAKAAGLPPDEFDIALERSYLRRS